MHLRDRKQGSEHQGVYFLFMSYVSWRIWIVNAEQDWKELFCCFKKKKGIYRVNGAKSRVEKLCQAFENGKDLVELSDLYPHDISNVLKLYLRQVSVKLLFTNIFLMLLIYVLLLAIIQFIYLRNFKKKVDLLALLFYLLIDFRAVKPINRD